jgi:cold shock CspA family protein
MQGKIRWLSEERSNGFIVDDTAIDHHFSVQDIIGDTVPQVGLVVEFDSASDPRGPCAKAIRMLSEPTTSTENRRHDGPVKCKNCGEQMTPQIRIDNGGFEKSVCPYCDAPHKNSASLALWVWLLIIGVAAYEIIAVIRFYLRKS